MAILDHHKILEKNATLLLVFSFLVVTIGGIVSAGFAPTRRMASAPSRSPSDRRVPSGASPAPTPWRSPATTRSI